MPYPRKHYAFALLIAVAVLLVGESGRTAVAQSDGSSSVWSVDLIRTLPGQQSEYLRNIEANWSGARRLAVERGAVLSYRALAAPSDSSRGWDIILMTEYADSTAYAQREDIFRAIFDSPEFVRLEMDRPSSELREFVAGGVTMWGVKSGGSGAR